MEGRLNELLFEGEEIEERTSLDAAEIAVTTHRVLVLTPEGDGRAFDHADRPNVAGTTVENTGEDAYLNWGVRSGVYGIALLSGGYLLKQSGVFGVLSDAQAEGSPELGGILQVTAALSSVFETLTGLLLLVGILSVLAAGALLYRYNNSRSQELVIELAGRDPIQIPVEEAEGERAVDELQRAL